jgi:hypothetical protein
LFLPAALAPANAGEVIDGIVVTVNRAPIFRSDWDEAVCYELFMQRKPLSQLTAADRVAALQRLIDRQLLKAQMFDAHSMQPSEEDLQNDLAKLRSQVPEGKNDESWRKLLASYGLSEELLKAQAQAAPATQTAPAAEVPAPAQALLGFGRSRYRRILVKYPERNAR